MSASGKKKAAPKADVERCDAALRRMLEDNPGLIGAIVSTGDGHVVAAQLPDSWEHGDVAAMTSSMMALGESVSRRTDLEQCRNVVVESEKGNMTLLTVDGNLTLTAFGDPKMNLGLQLTACRSCAQEINQGKAAGSEG